MGLIERTKTTIGAKLNKLVERFEDPRELLDKSYEEQIELLQKVKRGIADLATAKKRLEKQKYDLSQSIISIDEQARDLMAQGNEPLARAALERKMQTKDHIEALSKQIKEIAENQNKLTEKERVLQLKIEQFKAQKEMMKAQYSAAEAQSKVAETLSGIDGKGAAAAIRRAEDKTGAMQARASAIDELTDAGTLGDSFGAESTLDRDLAKARNQRAVEAELEAMRKRK